MVNLALKNCSEVFEGIDSIVDVGGGTGTTARIICEAFPKVKCVVFDLPHVVANLSCESKNVSYVGGDMFKSIPEADAIMLKVDIYYICIIGKIIYFQYKRWKLCESHSFLKYETLKYFSVTKKMFQTIFL